MKKKNFAAIGLAVALTGALFFPPVQSFAMSALSIFRVEDTKTIQITISDIELMVNYFNKNGELEKHHEDIKQQMKAQHSKEEISEMNDERDFKDIKDVKDFDGFSFDLPSELKDQQPKLYATEASEKSIDFDTDKVNERFAEFGLTPIDSKFDGTTIIVHTPPAIVAEYSDMKLFATQGAYFEAPDELTSEIWSKVVQLPFLSENLRAQLSSIDPKTRDVYLPVLSGVGRETAIGATTGYIYSKSDFEQFSSSLPESVKSIMTKDMPEPKKESIEENTNESMLIWTKNGVLYCLTGSQSDSELTKIARSIH